ncbi:aldolase/citrate lyase family protein [Nocardia sp. NPDC004860]|uniref:HpcH/HpaI aldolase family protein n=1 Tax=Nocardia sp. NPDC004860 TaxID=3154557 RepID=UPI0033A26EAA
MNDSFADLLRRSNRTLFGTWVKMPTTVSVELLALAGFDFVVIDMEHAPLGPETVHELIGAARGHRMPPLVRVPDHQASTISRVLDSGAAGVIVPHVDSAAEAAAVISAARFPPQGSRGFGPTVRAGAWGADVETYHAAGTEAFVALQLESRAAIDEACAIGTTAGIGGLFIGPVDLAIATGLAPDSAPFHELVNLAESTAKRLGIPLGTAIGADTAAARELAHRYDFVLLANDASLLRAAGTELMTTLVAR